MDFLNGLSMLIGYLVIGIITLAAIMTIISIIEAKVKDIKYKKTVIREGTMLFKDGKSFIVKKDLNVRFKKVKLMSCKCDELSECVGVAGIPFAMSTAGALRNFEEELMMHCVADSYKVRKLIEEQKKL